MPATKKINPMRCRTVQNDPRFRSGRLWRVGAAFAALALLPASPFGAQHSVATPFALTSDPRIVLPLGAENAWDAHTIYGPSIVRQGDTWHLLYSGNRVVESADPTRNMGLGYAISKDAGLTWAKQGDAPLLQHPRLRRATVGSWSLIDGKWILLYTVPRPDFYSTGSVYLAISEHGPEGPWNGPDEPVLRVPGGAWFEAIMPLDLFRVEQQYRLYFYGRQGKNGLAGYGLATSIDLMHWELYNDPSTNQPSLAISDPIVRVGDKQAWDGVAISSASVLRDGEGWELFYVGYDRPISQRGAELKPLALGRATSPDGIRWAKDPGNPVLPTNQTIWPLFEVLREGSTYVFLHDTSGGRAGFSRFTAKRTN
jgi:hypothetical protein